MKKIMAIILAVLMVLSIAASAMGEENRIWQLGDSGEKVTWIQQRLKDLEYLDREPTGTFDEETEEALRAFQWDNGLLKTGSNVSDIDFASRLFLRVDIVQYAGLDAAETEVHTAFFKEHSLKLHRIGVAFFRDLIDERSARIAESQNAGDLIKSLPCCVITGPAKHVQLIVTSDFHDVRMAT